MSSQLLNILLVDDDEEEYILTKHCLSQTKNSKNYQLDWEPNYNRAITIIEEKKHDLILLDYVLGNKTGLDFILEISKQEVQPPPVILLTGHSFYIKDMDFLKENSVQLLEKSQMSAPKLEELIAQAAGQ